MNTLKLQMQDIDWLTLRLQDALQQVGEEYHTQPTAVNTQRLQACERLSKHIKLKIIREDKS